MRVSIDQVRYVARLARLSFSPDQERRVASDLSAVLDYMQQLDELDTSDVPPMAHVLDRVDVFRPDRVDERMDREQALSNAPDSDGTYFRVPRIL